MVATAVARSVEVSCCPASAPRTTTRPAQRTDTERMTTRLIYLLLFVAPQILIYLYLRERLPDPARPRRARLARAALAAVFAVFNVPWIFVARRVLFGSVWGVGRIPYLGPWIAWQLLGWIFCAMLVVYFVGRVVWRTGGQLLRRPSDRPAASSLDRLTVLHLSDLHAGIHLEQDRMQEIVALSNTLGPDLIVQTGDMIDISPSYIPAYVHAFRDLHAPLGVVTVLGNHDRYTGEEAVVRGCRDAGQVFVKNGCHVVEREGASLALLGIDDPRSWKFDDPQAEDVDAALRGAPAKAFKLLLAHRPGAWDRAVPRGIPLTLAGHIHGGQLYVPVVGWSPGRMITKYVMGHFQRGESQLYVSRGIGVVGVPIRVLAPPEIALFELRRSGGPAVGRTVTAAYCPPDPPSA